MSKEKNIQKTWQQKFKPARQIGTIALATTIAFSVPAVSNVVSEVTPLKNLQVSVVHAQSENLMNVNETLTSINNTYNDEYEHWTHRFQNDGDVPVDGPDYDVSNLRYVVKFPDELSHLLDNQYTMDYLLGNITNFDSAQNAFMVTGFVIDENGDQISINKDNHEPYKYITVNQATNSIEFNFNDFYTSNNLEPYFRSNVNGEYFLNNFGFQTPIVVSDADMLDNGTYEFKTAIVEGESVDLDNVSNAYSENLVVDYSTDPEPEPEEPEVEKEALETVVAEAAEYNADDYTEESFNALASALTVAEEVVANEDATQEEVDEALASLEAAIDGLEEAEAPTPEPEVEKEALETVVAEAAEYNADDYTEESFNALASALTVAEEVVANEDATQEEVDEALAALEAAIDGLEETEAPAPTPEPEVEKEALEILVSEAAEYNADDYTEESFNALASALSAAEEVVADEDATQEEVDEALAALEAAIDGLEQVEEEPTPEPEPEVDTSDLEASVDGAKDYDAANYTESSFATFASALEAAEAVLADEDATQGEVNEALSVLESAVDGLVELEEEPTPEPDPEPTPDPEVETGALKTLAEKAEAYDGDNYTKDSFAALTEALESANSVLNDENATEDEVSKATENLQAAIDNLVEKEESEIIVEEVEEEETDVTVKGEEEDNRLPDTATNNYTSMFVGSLLAIFGGATLFIRRKIFREDI